SRSPSSVASRRAPAGGARTPSCGLGPPGAGLRPSPCSTTLGPPPRETTRTPSPGTARRTATARRVKRGRRRTGAPVPCSCADRSGEVEATGPVILTSEAWPKGKVSPTEDETTAPAPKKGRQREPLTDPVFKTLVHPDRKASIAGLRFSPDGKRLLAAGYPAGV